MERRTFKTNEEAYFDELEDVTSEQAATAGAPEVSEAEIEGNSKDGIDALDQFMASINAQLAEEKNAGPLDDKGELCEPDDPGADTYTAVVANRKQAKSSDDEADIFEVNKVSLLPTVEHHLIQYRPFQKDNYKEAECLALTTVEEKAELRRNLKLDVRGFQVPQAIPSLQLFERSLESSLYKEIRKLGWHNLTPIQAQVIPAVLQGRSVFGTAPAASGKTAAYSIPVAHQVCRVLESWKLVQMPPKSGPVALIVSNSRTHAMQIYEEIDRILPKIHLRVSCFCDEGKDRTQQFHEIAEGREVIVGQPRRLINLVQAKNGLSLQDVVIVVFDDVEKLVQEGLASEVMSICRFLRPDKQVLAFSRGFSDETEKLLSSLSSKIIWVKAAGESPEALTTVRVIPMVFHVELQKVQWLANQAKRLLQAERGAIVFVNSYGKALDIASFLDDVLSSPDEISEITELPYEADEQGAPQNFSEAINLSSRSQTMSHPAVGKRFSLCLHGQLSTSERLAVMRTFNAAKISNDPRILISTDVEMPATLPNVSLVLSFDAPASGDIMRERLKWTGRAGLSGEFIACLLRNKDERFAAELVDYMTELGLEKAVSNALKNMSAIGHKKLVGRNKRDRGSRSVGTPGLGSVLGKTGKAAAAGPLPDSSGRFSGFVAANQIKDDKLENSRWNAPLPKSEQPTTAAKVYGPHDEIESSDEDVPATAATADSSVLNLDKRRQREQEYIKQEVKRRLNQNIISRADHSRQWDPSVSAEKPTTDENWGKISELKQKSRWS